MGPSLELQAAPASEEANVVVNMHWAEEAGSRQ